VPRPNGEHINFSLWSAQRVAAYKSRVALMLDRPVAILNTPRLELIAPVFEGTDTLTLNRGLAEFSEQRSLENQVTRA
jgi:sortase (surface protein transpeptidase)